ncbi:MAG: hypothetical protein L6R39_003008 [Caloplaca ligustica]|nr:MAG: hypothetical protein L6R39_003008 [Caloplaca ligustica]
MTDVTSSASLHGKVALITGGGRGIGRGIAVELARRGASLIVTYVKDAESAESTLKELHNLSFGNIALQADVSNVEEIPQLFEEAIAVHPFHKLDIVVSNSGVEGFGHISEITPEDFDRIFAVNTRGQLFVAQQAYKHLSVGGRLVLMSSVSANAKGVPKHSIYAGSKAAIEAFARSLAVDFGPKKITVNAVAPGGVKSDMYLENARHYIPSSDSMNNNEIDERMANASPLKRVAVPEDVARVVAFLCSEDGGWVNGQTITITGGAAL